MNQLSPEARRLFQLARGVDEPSPATLKRIEQSLASRVTRGVGIAAAGTLWVHSASGFLLGTSKVVSIAVVAGAVSAAGVWALQSPEPASRASAPAASVARAAKPVAPRSAPQPVASASEAPVESTDALPKLPSAAATRGVPRPSVAPASNGAQAAETPDQLREETQELRQAQQALRAGNVALALKLLNQQDQTFGRGVLQEERSAARVLALCQNGQTDRARAEAARFEQQWPKSALLARVRSSCF
jgi:hypothetical protein